MKRRVLKRVRKSWQFRKLLRQGKYFRGNVLKARYLKNSLGQIRLGFSVSAKTGNAVRRNLFKRRLRQYSVEKGTIVGYDAVVFPVKKLENIGWEEMLEDMNRLTEMVNSLGGSKLRE